MWRKDFGYASRLAYVNRFVWLVVIFHAVLVVYFGFGYGAIPHDPNGRLTTWGYYRVFGQNVSIFAFLSTVWLQRRNFAGWRYWVHMLVCGLIAAYNSVMVAWGIIAYTQPWGSNTITAGEEPIGTPIALRTSPDWAFLSLMCAVFASACISVFYIVYGMWLRKRVEMQLMLSAAASTMPTNPNVDLMSGGGGGAVGFADYGGYAPGGAFAMREIGAERASLLPTTTNNGDGTATVAYHNAQDSALYCHDCFVSYDIDGSNLINVAPEEAPHVAAFIRDNQLRNVRFFKGAINVDRFNSYKAAIAQVVPAQHQAEFHAAADASYGEWARTQAAVQQQQQTL